MNKEEKLKMMKQRVLHSYKWEKEVTHPLAKEFEVSIEEFEDILMNHLDMGELENMFSTFEEADYDRILRQLHLDLRLYWFGDVLGMISSEEYSPLKHRLADDIKNGRKYEDCLKEGREKIISILKNH